MADLFEEVQQNLQDHFKSAAAPEVAAPVQETAPNVTTEPVVTEPVKTEPVVTEPVKTETPAPLTTEVRTEIYKELGYESPDQLKSSLNDLKTKAEEYDKKLPYFLEVENEFENLVKIADPMNLFKSEEEYNHFLMTQKLGEGKDFGVTQRIVRNDLDKMPDLDVVNLQWQFDAPRFAGKDDSVKRAILKQVGVDTDDPEFKIETAALSPDQDLALARMAQTARDQFNQAKASVQKPERPDFKQKLQEQVAAKAEAEKQNKEKFNQTARTWEEKVKGLPDSTYKYEFKKKNDKNEDVVDFVFNMDEEFKKEIPEMVMHHVLSNRMEPTPENVNYATDLVRRIYISDNYQKLVEAHTNQKLTELREQLDKERYNGTDFNTKTPPPGRDEDMKKQINEQFKTIAGIKI